MNKYEKWDKIANEYFENVPKHKLYEDSLRAGIRLSPSSQGKVAGKLLEKSRSSFRARKVLRTIGTVKPSDPLAIYHPSPLLQHENLILKKGIIIGQNLGVHWKASDKPKIVKGYPQKMTTLDDDY